MKEIKQIIAENLTTLRLKNKLTQTGLAQKINYTDKAVSKWENGDATPPIDVLKLLADYYSVSVDYIITENPSEYYDKTYNIKSNVQNKVIITALSVLTVWIIATVMFVYCSIFNITDIPWINFIISVPISFVVLLVFNSLWGKRKFTFLITSFLLWSILGALYIVFLSYNLWPIFLIGAPVQIGIILWSQLKKNKR